MKKLLLLAALCLSIFRTASAQTPNPTINGVPGPWTFTGSVVQTGQNFNFTGVGAGITDITSTGSTLTVTSPTGPTANLELNLANPNTWTGAQTFVAPLLGTPASGVITNLTGTCTSCTANAVTSITAAQVGTAINLAQYYFVLSGGTSSAPTGLACTANKVMEGSATTPSCTATPQLGASGTLGSLTFGNATSGLLTLEPATGALGTITLFLPISSGDTLVGLTATQTLTNKILTSASLSGSATVVPSGATLTIQSGGTLTCAAGSTCPSGTGTVTTSGTPTNEYYSLFTGSTVIGNGTIDHGVTTANVDTDTYGLAAPTIAATGATPGSMYVVAGTGNIPALASNLFGFAAPAATFTSILLKPSGAFTSAGILHTAASATGDNVNETVLTTSLVSLTGDVTGNLPNANLASQTANTVLGALTATTPSGLAMPSCSGATNALIWTSGTGFGCNTISAGSSAWSAITSGANTQTGAFSTTAPWTFSVAGAASTPGLSVTGAPYTGGSATTNFPQLYVNDGAGPTTFSTTGTEFGLNSPSGFTGNMLDFHVNGGASIFKIDYLGNATAGGTTAGFMDFGQGPSSAAVGACPAATSICVQAPTSVTSQLRVMAGAPASGFSLWTNSSGTMTETISGVDGTISTGPALFGSSAVNTVVAQTIAAYAGHFTNLVMTAALGGSCTTAPTFNVFDGTSNTGTSKISTATTQTKGTATSQTQTLTFAAGDLIGIYISTAGATCTTDTWVVSAEYSIP